MQLYKNIKKSLKEILLEENPRITKCVSFTIWLNILCMSFFILYPLIIIIIESNSLPEFFKLILAQKTALEWIIWTVIPIILTNKKLLGKSALSFYISSTFFILSVIVIAQIMKLQFNF